MKTSIVALFVAGAALSSTAFGAAKYNDETVTGASWSSKVMLWLDGSKTGTDYMQPDTKDGSASKYFKRWFDRRGKEATPWHGYNNRGETDTAGQYNGVMPYTVTGGPNGLTYVSLGKCADWGRRMPFHKYNDDGSETASTMPIRYIIMVFGSQNGGGKAVFNKMLRNGSTKTIADGIFKDNIATRADGVVVQPQRTPLTGGWQVLSFEAGDNSLPGLGWGDNGNNPIGGQNYGEILVFSVKPTEAEILEVEEYLMEKWDIAPHEREFAIPRDEWTNKGMSFTQQLTNAFNVVWEYDTIKIAAGSYTLDNESFMENAPLSGYDTVTNRTYLYCGGTRSITIKGSGSDDYHEWSDPDTTEPHTVLRGNGEDRFLNINGGDNQIVLQNLVLENFACSTDPAKDIKNNLSRACVGGAVIGSGHSDDYATNCIFRLNGARNGGAVANFYAYYCCFTNNSALSNMGGASLHGTFVNCQFIDNKAAAGGGACWWPTWIEGCEFIGNYANGSAGAIVGVGNGTYKNTLFKNNISMWCGGAMSLRQNSKFYNCRFEGNIAADRGGAIYSQAWDGNNGGRYSFFNDCEFVGNCASNHSGAVCDETLAVVDDHTAIDFTRCRFEGNFAPIIKALRPVGFSKGGGVFESCTFVGNHGQQAGDNTSILSGSDTTPVIINNSLFESNYIYGGGMAGLATVSNCVFRDNEVIAGGMVMDSTAYDCKMLGNRKWGTYLYGSDSKVPGVTADVTNGNSPGLDACRSKLYRCECDGGFIYGSVLVDCYIHTLTNRGSCCVFYGNNVATNCLIADTVGQLQGGKGTTIRRNRGIVYRWGYIGAGGIASPEYVNCTFANNLIDNDSSFGFVSYQQESNIPAKFLNCLFWNNYDPTGEVVDMRIRVKAAGAEATGVTMQNCVYGVEPSMTDGHTWNDAGNNLVISKAAQRLVTTSADAKRLGVAKYTPKGGSPVRGKGLASVFTSEDKDLAGNARLRDGKLDVGCYQSTLDPIGMMIWIK